MANWLRWFPWKFVISRFARGRGFIDPVKLFSRLESFAQPLEVKEPLELLRAGMVFHARGLLNAGAIQQNLDWVWPYWVERQYDPRDEAFIPRAFSLTHINLTHRNWTAVGLPDLDSYPIVDARGLLTPFWDGWSLDVWVIAEDGRTLVPARIDRVEQHLDISTGLAVVTAAEDGAMGLLERVEMIEDAEGACCQLELSAESDAPGWLVLALRPFNPEGVSFINEIALGEGHQCWEVNRKARIAFTSPADRHRFSTYRGGDVFTQLPSGGERRGVKCEVGMASAAALWAVSPGSPRNVRVRIPIAREGGNGSVRLRSWEEALAGACRLRVPDALSQRLYEAALRTLVLHAPGEVYPGPYTYKRFWFRDAAFILYGMIMAGFSDRVGRVLSSFPGRQLANGFFRSQEGEWDSNGEALWILERYCELTGRAPEEKWRRAAERGASWILRKRLSLRPDSPHAGLLPAGFSAEHLGPNDYYYWDDFWGVAGLRAAAGLLERYGQSSLPQRLRAEAGEFLDLIEHNLEEVEARIGSPAMPASPYRRLDSGAIGSLAAGYPLELWGPTDRRLLATVDYLLDHCFVAGGFFQDMIHSGINPYLTLQVAQVLLRAGDQRFGALRDRVAELASATGQWPEAIHPRTLGGCMGDGQHVWAAAEWVLMMRNSFVREEGECLILASGVPARWLEGGEEVSFGPTPSRWGPVTVDISSVDGEPRVRWKVEWRTKPQKVEIRLPGREPVVSTPEPEGALRREVVVT